MKRRLDTIELDPFAARLGSPLRAKATIDTLQINVGLVCNLACRHCHVASSPKRTGEHENLSEATAERLLDWLAGAETIQTVDLTGGSPEMNPQFRTLVAGARALGKRVMDRCNPTILVQRDAAGRQPYAWAPAFLAEHQVHVVASLPCYLEENVRRQRGVHAFPDSIAGLKRLNEVGYGIDPSLSLTLVYNPVGPSLPPPQAGLEKDYRCVLEEEYGVVFSELWALTNMPIARWREDLERQDRLDEYLTLLETSFNAETIDGLMCRGQIHVDSQGRVHDCDFNYALGLRTPGCEEKFLWDLDPASFSSREIRTNSHCFGCTAGSGSSCTGSLA